MTNTLTDWLARWSEIESKHYCYFSPESPGQLICVLRPMLPDSYRFNPEAPSWRDYGCLLEALAIAIRSRGLLFKTTLTPSGLVHAVVFPSVSTNFSLFKTGEDVEPAIALLMAYVKWLEEVAAS